MTQKPHVCLLDGTNMFHRAWSVSEGRGQEPASVLFTRMMRNLLFRMERGGRPPTHGAIFFDPPREGTWRRAIHPGYKAHRTQKPLEFHEQVRAVVTLCDGASMKNGVCETHEADDMLAAMALDALTAGAVVSVISTDKDLLQLVRPGLLVHNPVSGAWFNTKAVEEKFGVPPSLLGDYLALTGDQIDGVPGAPGIGPKKALALLGEFGTLARVLEGSAAIAQDGIRRSIEGNVELIRMSRRLVELDAERCPRPFDIMTAVMPGAHAFPRPPSLHEEDGPGINF